MWKSIGLVLQPVEIKNGPFIFQQIIPPIMKDGNLDLAPCLRPLVNCREKDKGLEVRQSSLLPGLLLTLGDTEHLPYEKASVQPFHRHKDAQIHGLYERCRIRKEEETPNLAIVIGQPLEVRVCIIGQQEGAHTVPWNAKDIALVLIHCRDRMIGKTFLRNLHSEPCILRKVINDWQVILEIPETTRLSRLVDSEGLERMHTVGVSATQDGDLSLLSLCSLALFSSLVT